VAFRQITAHVEKHALDQAGGFRARQAKLAMDDIRQIGPGQRARMQATIVPRTGDTRVSHFKTSRPVSTLACATLLINSKGLRRQFDI
jgi:hypothetical protein